METVYWSTFQLAGKEIVFAMIEETLCYVGSFLDGEEEMKAWALKHIGKVDFLRDDTKLKKVRQQFEDYIHGERRQFDIPLKFFGTPFQQEVWLELLQIHYGESVSYSEVAERIGRKSAVRAVANAIGKNHLPIVVPCHRVLGKDGSLTGYSGGLEMKKTLLTIEKIHCKG